MKEVSTQQARANLAELLELAFYKNERILVKRNEQPMAWLVGQRYIKVFDQLVAFVIEHQPEFADTLALELDDEMRGQVEQSRHEMKAGKLMPLEEALA